MNQLWTNINENIPDIIAFLANLDILILIATFFSVFAFFSTIGKDVPATVIIATYISFFILQIPNNLISWLVEQSNQPPYLVFIAVFLVLTFIIARLLFKNEFFEPMTVPDSVKERLFFSAIITGLWAIILVQVFPAELQELTSSSFNFLFFNTYSTEFWAIISPISLFAFIKGE